MGLACIYLWQSTNGSEGHFCQILDRLCNDEIEVCTKAVAIVLNAGSVVPLVMFSCIRLSCK